MAPKPTESDALRLAYTNHLLRASCARPQENFYLGVPKEKGARHEPRAADPARLRAAAGQAPSWVRSAATTPAKALDLLSSCCPCCAKRAQSKTNNGSHQLSSASMRASMAVKRGFGEVEADEVRVVLVAGVQRMAIALVGKQRLEKLLRQRPFGFSTRRTSASTATGCCRYCTPTCGWLYGVHSTRPPAAAPARD